MPIVVVEIDEPARAAYFELYKQAGVERVKSHMRLIWDSFQTTDPWIPMVYLHRAVQGYAFLNDPDAMANLDARYPTVKAGVPSYGATYAEVAMGYVEINRTLTWHVSTVYESFRATAFEAIPIATDKPIVDHLVDAFINGHTPGGWT